MSLDWTSAESHILNHPSIPLSEEEKSLRELLPAHIWVTTSGTTRLNRRWIALGKEAFLASARAVNEHLRVGPEDIWLRILPTFHVGGLGIWARAFCGGQKVVDREFVWSATEFVELAEAQKVTLTSLVPAQVHDLVAKELSAPRALRAVVVGGGALSPELYARARKLDWPILPSFGMTECCSQVATAPIDSLRAREWPRLELLKHMRARVTKDGRLQLFSPSLMTGYARWEGRRWRLVDPKVEGWYETEDRVELSQGALKPLGRLNDQVKVLGELVDLARLEERLQALILKENVLIEANLIATPHPRREHSLDLVVAPLEPSGRWFAQAEQIFEKFNEDLLPFERARNLYGISQLPRTELGKLKRSSLLDELGF